MNYGSFHVFEFILGYLDIAKIRRKKLFGIVVPEYYWNLDLIDHKVPNNSYMYKHILVKYHLNMQSI